MEIIRGLLVGGVDPQVAVHVVADQLRTLALSDSLDAYAAGRA